MQRNNSDILRKHARENDAQSPTVFRRLLGFLACRCLQNIEFAECLLDWKDLTFEDTPQTTEANLILMEKYAILICQIQQTPEQQLISPRNNIAEKILKSLDDIAIDCRNRIHKAENLAGKPILIADKLLIAKDVIVQ